MSAQPSSIGDNEKPTPPNRAEPVTLRPPNRWHDPLRLIQTEAPDEMGRIVLWGVCILVLIMIVWAAFGKLDIIASAEGKLVPQTLVKVVQPADAGVIKELLVDEGDTVKAGQVLARLDTTLAAADKAGITSDLSTQKMQVRRIQAELAGMPMTPQTGDNTLLYQQVHNQYEAHRRAYLDSLEQEKAMLAKAEQEEKSAVEVLDKLAKTVPIYRQVADNYADMAKQGYVPALQSADKQIEATEKAKDLEAQRSTVASLHSAVTAQQKKISQLQSSYQSDLQKELADTQAKIGQLQPNLDKTVYKEGLLELRAPQDGVIKDLATTTVGAVVQPGAVVLTLVPKGERLYADVQVKNEDVGFVKVGQKAQIKLSAYPFQQYGMLTGKVIEVSADATEATRQNTSNAKNGENDISTSSVATYKARVELDRQTLKDPQGIELPLTPGMQVIAEINQGKRTVLEYLLSPVQKAVQEAARER